ncbi:hypothetical protein OG293_00910 [Streptomyces sp. NBC_00829]|nr:hypothetical protein OG293_00910 [Streptomyces sp. NBC_00829]
MTTPHQGGHPGEEGPGRQPQEEGKPRRPPRPFGAGLYRDRNTVERLINRLKDWRGIATRFDKTPESYLAGLELRASMIWLGELLQAAD